jgi:hypothetical protein
LVCSKSEDLEMGIVRFALRFPYTFYVVAAFIVFLGVTDFLVERRGFKPLTSAVQAPARRGTGGYYRSSAWLLVAASKRRTITST